MTNSFIAQLKAKYCRTTSYQKYWILELRSHPTLTKRLLSTKAPQVTTFFLFGEKVRWASRLVLNQDYCWFYRISKKKRSKYYQIQDWKLLGEPETVKRMSQLLKKYAISI